VATERVDLLIVGAGPAGLSTALHLVAADPAWVERMLVVEKAVHPRRKLCAGGITGPGLEILERLDLDLGTTAAPVAELRLRYGAGSLRLPADPPFQVVCREAFDAALVRQAEERGVRIRQGETVEGLARAGDRIEVATTRRRVSARAVVAGDGSNSAIRRQLVRLGWLPRSPSRPLARLLEVRRSATGEEPEFRRGLARFDFSTARDHGLQGYAWSFPSWVDGKPVLNSGIFDSRAAAARRPAAIVRALADFLEPTGSRAADLDFRGFPIRTFAPDAPLAAPGALLVGDAAGVDPLLGEGISFALAYGEVAASALAGAHARDDYALTSYKEAVLAHPLLGQLPGRAAWARRLYRLQRPWQQALVFRAFAAYASLRGLGGLGGPSGVLSTESWRSRR
jgi:flavin-dependent dehydrogenase